MFAPTVFDIQSLACGGLITTYNCPSRCRHCLYASGPERNHDYMDAEIARRACSRIKSLHCNTIHIGGGEPMLNPRALATILETATLEGLRIEYVETNCAWFRDMRSACTLLQEMRASGLETLLISISPFHNEHIPLDKVNGVMRACEETGVSVFPWVLDFYNELKEFNTSVTHSLEEFQQHFGPDYLNSVAKRYWIHFGGRALRTFESLFEKKTAQAILDENPYPCSELSDTSHFHIDLYGNYIPGLCTGLALDLDDLAEPTDRQRYPLLGLLCSGGINALFEDAVERKGFAPHKTYISKCDLCQHIRSFLVIDTGLRTRELQPVEFYTSMAGQ
jgi:organic radical activating enzyme